MEYYEDEEYDLEQAIKQEREEMERIREEMGDEEIERRREEREEQMEYNYLRYQQSQPHNNTLDTHTNKT